MTVFPAMPFLPQLFLTPEAFQRSEVMLPNCVACGRSSGGRTNLTACGTQNACESLQLLADRLRPPSQWRRPARMRALDSRHRCLFNLAIEAAGLV